MNKIKQHIYKAMLWLLPWMCAVPLASCSFDDDIDTGDDNAPAMLQLSITAREEGDLNTREGTEVGAEQRVYAQPARAFYTGRQGREEILARFE